VKANGIVDVKFRHMTEMDVQFGPNTEIIRYMGLFYKFQILFNLCTHV